jgi:methyl-accepting chemotaxis protein
MNFLKKKTAGTSDNKDLTRSYLLLSFLLGAGLTLLFYKVLILKILPGTYYDEIFTKRGIIPYITTLLFFWGLFLLVFSWLGLRKEESTFNKIKNIVMSFETIDKESAHSASDQLKQIRESKGGPIASNRFVRAMQRIKDGIKNNTEVLNMLRDQADIDSMIISAKNAPVKFFIWLIPVLGFIGTVLGVSAAIVGFSDIIQAGTDFSSVKGSLGGVSINLGVAFDTTLLALIKTAVLMFAYSSLQKQEQSFLISMDEFSVDDLIKKVVPDIKQADRTETGQLTHAVEQLTEKITTWDPKFSETLNSFFDRLRQYSYESLKSAGELFTRIEQVSTQNSETSVAISGSIDRFKEYSSEAVRSAGELFKKVEEVTGQNSETALTISGSMDRFKQYSEEAVQSAQNLFASIEQTTSQNSETATAISGSIDQFRQCSDGAVESAREMLKQVEQAAGLNSESAAAISGSINKFDSQIQEFNSMQSSIQDNIKCITDLEEFNRCLGLLSKTLDQLPSILNEMKQPREIRFMESRIEDKE